MRQLRGKKRDLGQYRNPECFKTVYSKRFNRVGYFRVIQRKDNGELVLQTFDDRRGQYILVGDHNALDAFVWLGRYLAKKNKLSSAIALEEIAVGSNRTTRAIRELGAAETLAIVKG